MPTFCLVVIFKVENWNWNWNWNCPGTAQRQLPRSIVRVAAHKSLGSSLQITTKSGIPTHFTTQMRKSKIESMSQQQKSSHAVGAQSMNGAEWARTNNEACWQLTPTITPCQTVLCRLCMSHLLQKPMVSPLQRRLPKKNVFRRRKNRILPLRCGSPNASTEVVHRPRSQSPLHFDIS